LQEKIGEKSAKKRRKIGEKSAKNRRKMIITFAPAL
jgi:hypothetical protein